jgi:hypothetical protein
MRMIFALLAIGFATTSFAADPAMQNYYPLVKGTKWEYRFSQDEREVAFTCEITEVIFKEGRTHARMLSRLPNSLLMEEELSTDDNGVYRTALLGTKLAEPFTIIKYPVKARDGWKDKIKVGEMEGSGAITIRDTAAMIEVPAGKFKTLEVESRTELKGEKVVARIWYAEGVGIVKQETSSGSNLLTMELKKYTPAK